MTASDLSRRAFMAGTAAGALTALSPIAARAQDAAQTLKGSGKVTVSTWGGAYVDTQKAAFFKPFSDATGISVVTTGTPDAAKLKLMVESGNVEWDLMDAEGQMMFKAAQDGLLTKIDYDLLNKIVPKSQLIDETLQEYGFPSVAFGWVLVWNTKTVKGTAPKSWADFWDTEKFKGRRAAYAEARPMLEVALLADGVPKDKLYPLDVDRAFKKLDQIRSHIDVWVADTGQYDVLMQNGEVDLLMGSLGRAYLSKSKGVAVDYTLDDGLWQQSFWVIPKSAPNVENAQKLIAWMAQASGEANFISKFPFGVPNRDAYKGLAPEVAAALPTAPQNLPKEVQIDSKWWTDNLDSVNRRWLEWYSNG